MQSSVINLFNIVYMYIFFELSSELLVLICENNIENFNYFFLMKEKVFFLLMAVTYISLIIDSFCWTAFVVGILFNGLMIRLIIGHTPEPMRIYSKILLQTCVVDILLLTMTLLFFPYNFMTPNGEAGAIVYGLVTIKGVDNRFWNVLAFVCWVFLVYVSMFGYVAQFIFRYLVLVREKSISTPKYFLLLFLMLLFPFAYCFNLFICYFPSADHALMDDNSTAQMLGINLDTQKIVLAGYSFNNIRQSIGFYYMIAVCTIAYIIIFVLAFRIQKYLDDKSKISSSFCEAIIELNRQVSRNLIIQASMPLMIYLSVLFLLVLLLFKIDTNRWSWIQYYNLLASIPQFLPSAFNPIVSIWILQYYRKAVVMDFHCMALRVNKLVMTSSSFIGQRHSLVANECQQKKQLQQRHRANMGKLAFIVVSQHRIAAAHQKG